MTHNKAVYIVDGARTPFIKAEGKPNPLSATDLAVACGKPLLARQPFNPSDIGEVIIGCGGPSAEEANIARLVSLRLGCPKEVTAWTVQRNCASGLQAIDSAYKDISLGRFDLVLAGGTEAMSRAPLLFNEKMVLWFAGMAKAKSFQKKFMQLLKFRPQFLSPVIAILKGLNDASIGMNMGETAEKLSFEFGINKAQMDAFSVSSHQRAMAGYQAGHYKEVEPLFDCAGHVFEQDNGIREDSSIERLGKLKPVFEKPFGKVTAGNSSQVTDGACLLLLASQEAVEKYDLRVLGTIKNTVWSGVDPSIMGLGPAVSIGQLLQNQSLSLDKVDYFEINEAFAGQVLACVEAMSDEAFCKTHFESSGPIGRIPEDKLNIDGGAIALGHPVGASGARLVLHMLHTLKRTDKQRGIVSLCIGGGQGGAMLLEAGTGVA